LEGSRVQGFKGLRVKGKFIKMTGNIMDCMPCDTGDDNGPLEAEEKIREKKDSFGNTWSKVYFGSGAHFKNWRDQVLELFGKENVEIEPVTDTGLKCFDESDDKAYRIWVKKKNE
jgi:hypothetical protein